jgi:hypothetical protein
VVDDALSQYIENYNKDGDNPDPEFGPLCSSRMSQYLKDTGRVGKTKKEAK